MLSFACRSASTPCFLTAQFDDWQNEMWNAINGNKKQEEEGKNMEDNEAQNDTNN